MKMKKMPFLGHHHFLALKDQEKTLSTSELESLLKKWNENGKNAFS